MHRHIILCFLALTISPGAATVSNATDATAPSDVILRDDNINLNEFVWTKRPLVIFADSPADPRFVEQMAFITNGLADLAERDVVVLTDTDPQGDSALRDKLHPRGFMVALIGKDGTVKLRKPRPWDVRELRRVIDKMPLRQQEIRDRRSGS